MIWSYHVSMCNVSVLQKSELNQENIGVSQHFLRLENPPCLLSLIMSLYEMRQNVHVFVSTWFPWHHCSPTWEEKNLSSTIPESSVSLSSMSGESGRTPNHTHTPLPCWGADRRCKRFSFIALSAMCFHFLTQHRLRTLTRGINIKHVHEQKKTWVIKPKIKK